MKEQIQEYIEANYEELRKNFVDCENYDGQNIKMLFYGYCEGQANDNYAMKIDTAYDEWKEGGNE